MWIRRILAGIFLIGLPTSSDAVELVESTKYFTIRGHTLPGIERDIARLGPLNPIGRKRTAGAMRVSFTKNMRYVPGPRSCSIGSSSVGLRLDATQPKWRPSGRPDARTKIVYEALQKDVLTFQKDQRRIALSTARDIETAVSRVRPQRTCADLERQVVRTAAPFIKRHETAQLRLIDKYGKGFEAKVRRALRSAPAS
ncbi:DUF922 domain-containing protein [Aureimonas jatrophae]|uniref:DUF922 domain-containing protein n=1 Tax=Aureimonas jatrophae TaxID=1166073 RepID=UPI000B8368EA